MKNAGGLGSLDRRFSGFGFHGQRSMGFQAGSALRPVVIGVECCDWIVEEVQVTACRALLTEDRTNPMVLRYCPGKVSRTNGKNHINGTTYDGAGNQISVNGNTLS